MKQNFISRSMHSLNSNGSTQFNASEASPFSIQSMVMTPEVFVSKSSGNGYPVIQSNGCRKYGPPGNWIGPEPPADCELYIKDIPKDFLEHQLIPHFERFGRIYEFRLMMDYDNNNRGYGYVRYSKPEEAATALDVMKHFIMKKGLLSIQKSYHKCRLFVSNLPRDIPQEQITEIFQAMFPQMSSMSIHVTGQNNRAFGFIDFPDHKCALEAKVKSSPGYMELFGREIKIVWAFPDRQQDHELPANSSTLFIRNIGLAATPMEIKGFLASSVPKSTIRHISTVRDFAFVEFTHREAAQTVKDQLAGKILRDSPIEIEWARPPSENSVHILKKTDFDAELRTKCIANYWDIPIVIYGRLYETIQVQIVAIILKCNGIVHYFFIEISYKGLVDIHSRVSEIIVAFINEFNHLPKEHLVVKAEGDFFAVVGFVRYFSDTPVFIPSGKANGETRIFWEEMYDLALMSQLIVGINTNDLYMHYESQLKKSGPYKYLDALTINGRVLGCFDPTIRNKAPLKHGLPNHQMIFVLCDGLTQTNYMFITKATIQYPLKYFYANGTEGASAYFVSGSLLPLRFVQAKRFGSTFERVIFGQLNLQHCMTMNCWPQMTVPSIHQSQIIPTTAPRLYEFPAYMPTPTNVIHNPTISLQPCHSSFF